MLYFHKSCGTPVPKEVKIRENSFRNLGVIKQGMWYPDPYYTHINIVAPKIDLSNQ
jgi:hypothetical protein